MHDNKNLKAISLVVTDELAVTVLPNTTHEFLMTTKEVALGYGVSEYNIRRHKLEHSSELIEGKHLISGVSIPHVAQKGATRATLWTKRGIVRLGFFIRSERAKLFRDWAEDLILAKLEGDCHTPLAMTRGKRNHNRMTPERLLDIMQDVCRIEDKELRLSISAKLTNGGHA